MMIRISIHLERTIRFGKLRITPWSCVSYANTLRKQHISKLSNVETTSATNLTHFQLLEDQNDKFKTITTNYASHGDASNGGTSTDLTRKRSTRNLKWLGDNTFLNSLKIYKSIHRHIEVPKSFIVPENDAWPVEYHGYRLGEKVGLIRRSERYISDAYKSELNSLGFIWKPMEYRFHKTDLALQIYKKLHGHLKVPIAFIVPSKSQDWPELLWGYKLGEIVRSIRVSNVYETKRKYFEEMGFVFESKRCRRYNFADIKESLQIYKKRYGTFHVFHDYIIKQDDMDFPKGMRGARLGKIVYSIIRNDYFSEHHKELEQMGMQLLPRLELEFNRKYEAMQCYKKLHGQLTDVPRSYKVPEGSKEFPPHLWGIKLGYVVSNIRSQGAYKAYHDRLRELGVLLPVDESNTNKARTDVSIDSTTTVTTNCASHGDASNGGTSTDLTRKRSTRNLKWLGDNTFLNLLMIYKSIHRHIEVPKSFIVPENDAWPVEYHGYRLGDKVGLIRRNERYISDTYKSELNSLGFIWKPMEYSFHKADLALQIYKKLHGHLKVPIAFIVPSKSQDWPELLWGYKLGNTVQCIRVHNAFPMKRKYLEEMGFIFDKQRQTSYKFADIQKSIQIYKKRNGTFDIPTKYIIGTDDMDFPKGMRGAKLGVIIKNILHNNHYSKHHKKLEKMGMQLLPKMQLEFNRKYEAMQCYKKLYGQLTNVPRTYMVPEGSKEFPPHLWGIKLGYVLSNIRCQGVYKAYYDKLRELGVRLPVNVSDTNKARTDVSIDSTTTVTTNCASHGDALNGGTSTASGESKKEGKKKRTAL